MHPAKRRVLIGIAVALLASLVLASQLLAAPVVGVFCSPVPRPGRTPVLTLFAPNQGQAGTAHTVWIMGRNLSKGTPITISLDGTNLRIARQRHPLDNWVMATIPSSLSAGVHTAQVCNNANVCSTLANAYTAVGGSGLALRSVMPSSGYANQSSTILLIGSNFTPNTTFSIGSTPMAWVTVVSGKWAVAGVPSGLTPGAYSITATDPTNGSATLANGFLVLAPRHSRGRP